MKKYILEAHRGVGTEFPEETMSAFAAAVQQGYGMIELDTKFTKDNRCVLLHDRTVNRTGRLPGGEAIAEKLPISEMTLEEALRLDFGIWKNELFAGEKIPVLEQVLELSKNTCIPLKFDNVLWSHTPEQQKIFFDRILSENMQSLIGVTCNSMEGIRTIRQVLPEAHIHYDGLVTAERMEEIAGIVPFSQLTTWLRYDNAITAWCKNPPVSEQMAAMVKTYGGLGVWLLTETEELIDAVTRYGADIIETDGRLKPDAAE
ncbi:MAG: glycerophosphodiester phosphodiesterase family protein [Clostridia bacterium]|nr:glycerophosphodiester phosphodiesterase family protein [Clostridia bacterium]